MNGSKALIAGAVAASLALATNVVAGNPPKKAAAGWRALFDGRTTKGWRGYKATETTGWKVVGGTLAKEGTAADILTNEQFESFELEFDWKLAKGGNAGVFYRGTEEYEKVYWSAPEYQLLDDTKHEDAASRLTSAGAAYALYPAPAGIAKAGGQWNRSRIVARGAHVEHWLNGKKLLEYEAWSPDWEAKVKGSKFAAWPNFGRARKGHIAIQGDHEGHLALRNIRIRELE